MLSSLLSGPPLWFAAVVAPTTTSETALKVLADKCGSQIEWINDGPRPDDGGAAFKYVTSGPKPEKAPDLKALLAQALERARNEQRLVLWHIYRFQGPQMYRAPNLDDYMDQVLWTDPDLVELVSHQFVPLRTNCTKELGKDLGLVAWDYVEPAIAFLTPDGKLVHVINRIRTFDPKWFAEVFRRVLAAHPDCAHADPAAAAKQAFTTLDATALESTRQRYYDGLTSYLSGHEKDALAKWQELAETIPESPFAWRAAANLIPAADKTWPGAARHGFEWPFETHQPEAGELPTDTRWRRTPADAESVAQNAVHWLLHMQRPDGSWNDCRYAYWDTPVITPNAWMAITALAATALTEWHDVAPVEIDDALARAEDYLFKDGRLNVGKNEECYADAYRILYLQRTIETTEDKNQKKELLARVQQLVDQLAPLQHEQTGQWAHEYDNAFCTGAIVESLKRAKDLGAKIPEATIKKALEGLTAARLDDGSFLYGGTRGKGPQPTPNDEGLKNSCGRMPVCEAALFDFGKSDVKSVAKALAIYQQYYDRFEKISKCDFHTDGELGGFFFFHDFFHATEAVKLLPAAQQKPLRKWFLEKITSLPEIDGAFLDDHELGKSCSTAFGLLALKNALE